LNLEASRRYSDKPLSGAFFPTAAFFLCTATALAVLQSIATMKSAPNMLALGNKAMTEDEVKMTSQ
jgi:hypothetical protein